MVNVTEQERGSVVFKKPQSDLVQPQIIPTRIISSDVRFAQVPKKIGEAAERTRERIREELITKLGDLLYSQIEATKNNNTPGTELFQKVVGLV